MRFVLARRALLFAEASASFAALVLVRSMVSLRNDTRHSHGRTYQSRMQLFGQGFGQVYSASVQLDLGSIPQMLNELPQFCRVDREWLGTQSRVSEHPEQHYSHTSSADIIAMKGYHICCRPLVINCTQFILYLLHLREAHSSSLKNCPLHLQ